MTYQPHVDADSDADDHTGADDAQQQSSFGAGVDGSEAPSPAATKPRARRGSRKKASAKKASVDAGDGPSGDGLSGDGPPSGGGSDGDGAADSERPARKKRRSTRTRRSRKDEDGEASASGDSDADSADAAEAGDADADGDSKRKAPRRRRGSRGGRRRKRQDEDAVTVDAIPGEDDEFDADGGEDESGPPKRSRGRKAGRKAGRKRAAVAEEDDADADGDDEDRDGEESAEGLESGGKKKRRRRRSRRKTSDEDADGEEPEAAGDDDPDGGIDEDGSEEDGGKRSRRGRTRKKKAAKKAAKKASKKASKKSAPKKTAEEKAAEAEAMRTQTIAVNAVEPEERRVAVYEGDRIVDFLMNAESQKTLVNDIYRGRVVNLEPAIGAAFIDFGQGRNGFLHTSDVMPLYGEDGFKLEDLLTAGIHHVEGDHDADWSEEADALDDVEVDDDDVADEIADIDHLDDEDDDADASSRESEDFAEGPADFDGDRSEDAASGAAPEASFAEGLLDPAPADGDEDDDHEGDDADHDLDDDLDEEEEEEEAFESDSTDAERVIRAGRRAAPVSAYDADAGDSEGDSGRDGDGDAPKKSKRARRPRRATKKASSADSGDSSDDGAAEGTDDGAPKPRRKRASKARSSRKASADDDRGDEADGGGDDDERPKKRAKKSRSKKAASKKKTDAKAAGDDEPTKGGRKKKKKASRKADSKSTRSRKKSSGRSPSGRPSRGGRGSRSRGERRPQRERRPIDQLLRVGDPVVVQVTKDAIGDKGPTLTTYVSMPGRYLVLMPSMARTGVSRKIPDDKERKRLKRILASMKTPPDMGVIVRTAGVGRTKTDLQRDLDYLLGLWESFGKKLKGSRGPTPLYLESDVATRTLRDLFNRRTKEVIVDDVGVHDQMTSFAEALMPEHVDRIKKHEGDRPLFQHCGIEQDFERIFARRVDLPSGGSVVFDQAEALVAIDVNSGRTRTDSYDFEEIALKTNLEAVPEIARQIKLRDLGGIIVCDFIDMMRSSSNRQVEKALRTELSTDRARSKLSRISQFGLLEMTRQRLGPGTHKKVFQACPRCRGTARIRTVESRAQAILRRLGGAVVQKGFSKVEVRAHPEVVDYLKEELWDWVRAMEHRSEKEITLTSVPDQPEDSVLRYLRADGREVRPGGRRKR